MADQMADLVVCADPSAPCCPASPCVDQIPGVDAGSQQEIAVALRRHKQRGYMKAWRAKRKELTEGSVVAPSPQLAVAMGQPCVPSAQDKGALGPPRALTGMATPQDGDRILVFRPRWLNLLLDKEKDLEIRGRNLSSGPCWLGCRGTLLSLIHI